MEEGLPALDGGDEILRRLYVVIIATEGMGQDRTGPSYLQVDCIEMLLYHGTSSWRRTSVTWLKGLWDRRRAKGPVPFIFRRDCCLYHYDI